MKNAPSAFLDLGVRSAVAADEDFALGFSMSGLYSGVGEWVPNSSLVG